MGCLLAGALLVSGTDFLKELLRLAKIPAVMILFSCVFGITVNLHFPVLEWEKEVRIVKQNASAMLGGMGGKHLAVCQP